MCKGQKNNMDRSIIMKKLKLHMNLKGQLILDVVGNSMLPVLSSGDRIKIIKTDNIVLGDVIVFFYGEELLVHRVLRIKNHVICCKGDNSFRIEKIDFCDVVGKVVSVIINDMEIGLMKPENDFIELSYAIGKEFTKLGYDKVKILQSVIYSQYQTYFESYASKQN